MYKCNRWGMTVATRRQIEFYYSFQSTPNRRGGFRIRKRMNARIRQTTGNEWSSWHKIASIGQYSTGYYDSFKLKWAKNEMSPRRIQFNRRNTNIMIENIVDNGPKSKQSSVQEIDTVLKWIRDKTPDIITDKVIIAVEAAAHVQNGRRLTSMSEEVAPMDESGQYREYRRRLATTFPDCPDCRGTGALTGYVWSSPCARCFRTGKVRSLDSYY